MSNNILLEKINKLPDEKKQSVEDYIDFLLADGKLNGRLESNTKKGKRELLGAWKGKVKMAPDFDAPLEDFKDYM